VATTSIITKTSVVPDGVYSQLPVYPNTTLVIYAVEADIRVVCGQPDLASASDANSFLLPAGSALDMTPAPKGPVFVKTSTPGATASYWWS